MAFLQIPEKLTPAQELPCKNPFLLYANPILFLLYANPLLSMTVFALQHLLSL